MSATAIRATDLARCERVTVSYGQGDSSVTALADIDLTLRPGETLALLGPSGSGKTTLLHVLGGLVKPTSGTVHWKGQPLSTLDASAAGEVRARGIAYVFQGSGLLPVFTAYENVSFAAWVAARAGVTAGHAPAELLELVGLGAKRDALPSELSGGESQRVSIARALAQAPELVLCDEPTGQLDSDTGARVLDLIDAVREQTGFTLVVATHDHGIGRRYERSARLADGRIVEQVPA